MSFTHQRPVRHSVGQSTMTSLIHAIPDANNRGRPNTTNQSFHGISGQGKVEARIKETYPEGTFEALLIIAVDWSKYLQELQDALLVVEIGYLLKRLLDQLTESFSLKRIKTERG